MQRAKIKNKNVRAENFSYDEVVEIIDGQEYVLGHSLNDLIHPEENETIIKKEISNGQDIKIIIQKCFKQDLQII